MSSGVRELLVRLQLPLLEGLRASELDDLLEGSAVSRFAAEDVLLGEGEFPGELMVVVEGKVRVARGPARRALAELGPGACVGEISMVTGEAASASVIAAAPCQVVVIRRTAFERVMERSAALNRNIGRILAERLRDTTHRFAEDRLKKPSVLWCAPEAWECARAVARFLGAELARLTRRGVVVVDLGPGASSWELAELVAKPSRLAAHAKAGERGEVTVIDAALPPGMSGAAVQRAVRALAGVYEHVLLAVPLGTAVGRVLGPMARHQLCIGGGVEGEGVTVLSTEGPEVPAERDRMRGGRRVRVIRGWDGEPMGEPARSELGWVARLVAGLRVAVALGSGGTRGYAHVGALETFRELGIPVDALAGTSAGSVVGAMWGFGLEPDRIHHHVHETWARMRPGLLHRSLLGAEGLASQIRKVAAGRGFEDARMPLAVVATDLYARSPVIFRQGPVDLPLLASCSVPGILPPVKDGDRWLVDGAVSSPVPTTVAAELGGDVVIGVKLSQLPVAADGRHPSVVETLVRSLDILQERIGELDAGHATVIIQPSWPATLRMGLQWAAWGRSCRELGRQAALAALPRLRQLLPWLQSERS